MPDPNHHPNDETLRAFSLGTLGDDRLHEVSEHISHCEQCATALDTPSDDSLVNGLRELGVDDDSEVTARSFNDLQTMFAQHGRYKLIRQIGSGGMGAVFLAHHERMNRNVAIKVIRQDLSANPQTVLRFQQEVQSAAQLSHRNVVTAYDADQIGEVHFLVMEFIDGESLRERIDRKGRLPVMHACNYALQAAWGLDHAHSLGMVHRDVKPANLMRTRKGLVKVMDFGLARCARSDDDGSLTASGVVMGTASFIAPEQARDSKTADIRSDLYSLGCTLYYLLSGESPFDQSGYVEQVIAHCTDDFPDIRQTRGDVPDEVAAIINKLTAKNPDERYQTPAELIQDLSPLGKPAGKLTQTNTNTRTPLVEAAPAKQTKQELAPTMAFAPVDVQGPPSLTEPAKATANDRRKIVAFALIGVVMLGTGLWSLLPNRSGTTGRGNAASNGPSPKRVLLVISATSFWYSDYGPIREQLTQAGIECVATSSRTGTARFNQQDAYRTRETVDIATDITSLVKDGVDDFDAVVFMGDEYAEFIAGNEVGGAVQNLLTRFRGKKWIASIGKGTNIPVFHLAYNGATVADSQWIVVENASAHLPSTKLVVVDAKNKVITANRWQQASQFADELAKQLNAATVQSD